MRQLEAPRPRVVPRGEKTRQDILTLAVDIASAEGLEGLTIGRLAKELRMSKSGLFAHFASKEGLQLAAVDFAREIFVGEVIGPAQAAPRGLPRLRALLEGWLSYVERRVFRGGCFFAAASSEFDSRPGLVRDEIAKLMKAWRQALEDEAREAQNLGQIAARVDPAQLSFEIHALALEANWAHQLLSDRKAFERARAGIWQRLQDAATGRGLSELKRVRSGRK